MPAAAMPAVMPAAPASPQAAQAAYQVMRLLRLRLGLRLAQVADRLGWCGAAGAWAALARAPQPTALLLLPLLPLLLLPLLLPPLLLSLLLPLFGASSQCHAVKDNRTTHGTDWPAL